MMSRNSHQHIRQKFGCFEIVKIFYETVAGTLPTAADIAFSPGITDPQVCLDCGIISGNIFCFQQFGQMNISSAPAQQNAIMKNAEESRLDVLTATEMWEYIFTKCAALDAAESQRATLCKHMGLQPL